MQQTIETIREEILDAINNDELLLPTMPEVAIRLREAANDENADVNSISNVIGTDAALTARIIKIANSPLVRGLQTVDDLKTAVSRMGVGYTSNLAIGIALEQLFQATSEAVDNRMRDTWEHSTEVAGLCHVLSQHFTQLSPDQATLAGLVHEIGKLPILAWGDNHGWDEETLDTVMESLHPEFGKMILEAWEFPEELLEVPTDYVEFERTQEAADYVDVVMVANLHTYVGTEHPFAELDWSKIKAFANLNMDFDLVISDDEELGEEIAMAMEVLH